MMELFSEDDVVSVYSTQQAVEDGILVAVGHVGKCPVFTTRNCMVGLELEGSEDDEKRRDVVGKALAALRKPDREDDGCRKLRAFEVGEERVWVILDGQGLTIMLPEDY